MAQSTAEELAANLPQIKYTRAKGLTALLWKRNRGYLNRKATSFLFDLLELISLAVLADVDSLKYFYIIWVVFYFSQNILESLFYSARKIYVYEKKLPSKRILAYVHILVAIIPIFFSMVSIERFSHNNIAITYLLFKAIILTVQILLNYINFEAQTLTRIYYPPLLNWGLLVTAFIAILLVQNYSGPALSFYFVLIVITLAKLTQDIVVFKRIRSLKTSLLWQLKRDNIKESNSILDFFTLISIEVFLPLSILSLPYEVIDLKNMGLIFLVYMTVKLFLRPIRSLMLDHWSLMIQDNKILLALTYLLATATALFLTFLKGAPLSGIFLGFIYFNLLLIWNTRLLDNKIIIALNAGSLMWAILGFPLPALVCIFLIVFSYLFHLKFKTPGNLKKQQKVASFENKFILTFKEQPKWVRMAQLYPQLIWSPISKSRCLLESKEGSTEIQKLVLNHSYEIKLIEKMNLKLAKRFNLL